MRKVITIVVIMALILALGAGIGFTKTRIVTLNPTAWVPTEIMKALEKAFEKEHPEIDIVIETMPVSKYMESVLLRGAAGDLPDACMWWPDSKLNAFQEAGLIIPLDELIEKAGIDLGEYPKLLFELPRRGGALYAFPLPQELRGTVNYNKEIFEESGIPFITRDTTWKEFGDMARKLTVKDENGRVVRYGVLAKYPNLDLCYAEGARIVDDPLAPVKVLFGEDNYINTIRDFLSLAEEGAMMPLTVYKALGGSKPKIFGQKKVAAVVTNCNYKGRFADFDFEWDVELVPATSRELMGTHVNTLTWTISAMSKNPEKTFEWIRWFVLSETSLRVQESFLKFNKDNPPYVPELRKIWNEIAKTRKPDNWECLYEAQKYMVPYIGMYPGSEEFMEVYWMAVWDVLYKRKPLERLSEAAEECQVILDRMNAE